MTERLNELDREEFWDVARRLNPDICWEEFERDWKEFQALKAERTLH